MWACEHYKLFDKPTYISVSNGWPWNGWLEVIDEKGNVIYSTFQTGIIWEYLLHLLDNAKCRRKAKITKKEVLKKLKEIEREWERVTDP